MPPPPKRSKTDDDDEWTTVRYHVANPGDLTEKDRASSPEQMIDGFPMCVRTRKKNVEGTDRIAIYIFCSMARLATHWFADIQFEIRLVNQKNKDDDSIGPPASGRLDPSTNHSKAVSFTALYHLDPDRGYLMDGSITVVAKIKINNSFKRLKNLMDFFNPSELFDVALIVENKKVYASKQFLASQSPIFHALFYGGYKETDKAEIPLLDVDLEGFLHLLNYLYRTGSGLNHGNYEHLLRLADKFCINGILDEIENFLKRPELSFPLRLRLSDQYRLETVYDKCMSSLDSCEKISELKNSSEFESLSERTKDRLFDLYINKHQTTPESSRRRPL